MKNEKTDDNYMNFFGHVVSMSFLWFTLMYPFIIGGQIQLLAPKTHNTYTHGEKRN